MTKDNCLSADDLSRRRDALERTIDKMKQAKATGYPELGFDMTSWLGRNQSHECGTAACIAGWVVHANTNLELPDLLDVGRGRNGNVPDRAGEFLRLSGDEAMTLFFAKDDQWREIPFPNITVDHAIAVLEHFRDTGEVTWQVLPNLESLLQEEQEAD